MRRGRDHCETIENWRQDSVVPLVKLELKHPLGEGDGRTVQGQALVSLLVDETGQPSTESERTGQLVASQCAVSHRFSEMASAVERLMRQPPGSTEAERSLLLPGVATRLNVVGQQVEVVQRRCGTLSSLPALLARWERIVKQTTGATRASPVHQLFAT